MERKAWLPRVAAPKLPAASRGCCKECQECPATDAVALRGVGEDLLDDVTRDVGKAEVAALMPEGEPLVIET